jgi:hypothetical protein|nr:MAG TPA: tail collar domain protein [Caudoviricetes sp.]
MTTINEFLPFADQSNANLIPYAEWVSAAKRLTGFVSGIAKSNEMNRVFAQGAQAGYAIAKFIERTLSEDVYVADGERLADQFYRSIVQMSYRATPIGCILTFPVHVEIDGYVATNNGGNLSQTTYDQLYAVYGTKFNTSSTLATQFGIPDMAHRVFEAAATLEEIGCYVAAGLPNIKGSFHSLGGAADGCFTSGASSFFVEKGNVYGAYKKTFDASTSSSIYKDDVTTVRPEAFRAYCLIRYS